MKETGMMFKAPLVRAILAGQKTQTRRPLIGPLDPNRLGETMTKAQWARVNRELPEAFGVSYFSPFGQAGDRIYVRESFGYGGDAYTPDLYYRASQPDAPIQGCWHPAIHMPKSLARIWLEITGVRVERLHAITEADCIAEGATGGHGAIPGYAYSATPLEHFRHIWESTGARWDDNPWCWVYDFKRIERTQAQKGQA